MARRSPDQFNVFRAAAEVALSEGDYGQAEKNWLAALELAEGDDDPFQRLTAVLENLAETFWYQQKFELAAPILRRLLKIYERKLGKSHFDVGIVANNMAMLYHSWGKYADAEPFYERALAIKETVLGKRHPEIGLILENHRDLRARLKQEPCAAQEVKTSGWRRSGSTVDGFVRPVAGGQFES